MNLMILIALLASCEGQTLLQDLLNVTSYLPDSQTEELMTTLEQTIFSQTDQILFNETIKPSLNSSRSRRQTDIWSWQCHQPLNKVKEWLVRNVEKDMHEKKMASIQYIGVSHELEDIMVVKINDEDYCVCGVKKHIVVMANPYGSSWTSTMSALYLINELLTSDKSLSPKLYHLARHYIWHIIPVTNPDGFKFSFDQKPLSYEELWIKNRNKAYCPPSPTAKVRNCRRRRFNEGEDIVTNNLTRRRRHDCNPPRVKTEPREQTRSCIGANLYTNWPFMWLSQGIKPAEGLANSYFHGKEALSEKETKAIHDYIVEYVGREMRAYFMFREIGVEGIQHILLPYGYTADKIGNYDTIEKIAEKVGATAFPSWKVLVKSLYNYCLDTGRLYKDETTSTNSSAHILCRDGGAVPKGFYGNPTDWVKDEYDTPIVVEFGAPSHHLSQNSITGDRIRGNAAQHMEATQRIIEEYDLKHPIIVDPECQARCNALVTPESETCPSECWWAMMMMMNPCMGFACNPCMMMNPCMMFGRRK